MIAGLVKTLLLWSALCAYVVHSVAGVFFVRDGERRLRFKAATTHRYARIVLRVLGYTLKVNGRENIPTDGRVLFVSNHMSYLDIVAISSILPSLFITSIELQRTFFLGFIPTLGGSLFVERRSKSRLLEEIRRISDTIERKHPVVLFPEGTSSNGETVLPFKMALFAVAERSGFAVVPTCIRYHRIEGAPLSPDNRDRLFYYGGIRFFPHILQLPFVRSATLSICFQPPLPPSEGRSRKELAEASYRAVCAAYERAGRDEGNETTL